MVIPKLRTSCGKNICDKILNFREDVRIALLTGLEKSLKGNETETKFSILFVKHSITSVECHFVERIFILITFETNS